MSDERWEDRELDRLLRSLDHAPPPVTAEDVIARARRGRRGPVRAAAAVAATIALAGVAYALPGSPVPAWVDAALRAVGTQDPGETEGAAPTDNPGDPAAGLIFAAGEIRSITVAPAPGGSGTLRILLTDEAELVVRLADGSARFGSEPDGLSVELTSPGTLELRIPRSAPAVSVIAAGRPVFVKRGRELSTVMAPDSAGRYVLALDGGP